jgi:hypothetical protein
MAINILRHRDEVYHSRDLMERAFNDQFDRFEPDTGSFSALSKIADATWKKRARKRRSA